MTTPSTKKAQISHDWQLIDAKGKVLGRFATVASAILMGKNKPYFVRHLDCGNHLVIINASKLKVSGKKTSQKRYSRYSGYPGGLKTWTLAEWLATKPEEVVRHAISGMLPKNKLRRKWLARLHVFADEKHPYEEKLKSQNSNVKY